MAALMDIRERSVLFVHRAGYNIEIYFRSRAFGQAPITKPPLF